jgi:hypothetical protein
VPKYWTVTRLVDRNTIEVITRRGKKHLLRLSDPCLKPAGWIVEMLAGDRFPALR